MMPIYLTYDGNKETFGGLNAFCMNLGLLYYSMDRRVDDDEHHTRESQKHHP